MPILKTDASVVSYTKQGAADTKTLPVYLDRELSRIQTTLNQLAALANQVYISPPKRPITGMIVNNKAPWNPVGTGDGLVRYNGTAWVAVGAGGASSQGSMGPPGPSGDDGVDGTMGPQGNQGAIGSNGTNGLNGNDGILGPAGRDGEDGNDGRTGQDGIQGIQGLQGLLGLLGPTGYDGEAGIDGTLGPQGNQGTTGTTGLQGDRGPPGIMEEYDSFPIAIPVGNGAISANSVSLSGTIVTVQSPYTISSAPSVVHRVSSPSSMELYLECITTDLSYAVGDKILFGTLADGATASSKPSGFWNATNVGSVNPSGLPLVMNKTTFAQTAITAANWKVMALVFN